jgi:hypothetical protein
LVRSAFCFHNSSSSFATGSSTSGRRADFSKPWKPSCSPQASLPERSFRRFENSRNVEVPPGTRIHTVCIKNMVVRLFPEQVFSPMQHVFWPAHEPRELLEQTDLRMSFRCFGNSRNVEVTTGTRTTTGFGQTIGDERATKRSSSRSDDP